MTRLDIYRPCTPVQEHVTHSCTHAYLHTCSEAPAFLTRDRPQRQLSNPQPCNQLNPDITQSGSRLPRGRGTCRGQRAHCCRAGLQLRPPVPGARVHSHWSTGVQTAGAHRPDGTSPALPQRARDPHPGRAPQDKARFIHSVGAAEAGADLGPSPF